MTRDPREEAERLVVAALAAVSVAARSTKGFATGSAECCVCPLCKAIAAVRDPDPHFAERLASSAGDLATGLAGVLRAFGNAAASGFGGEGHDSSSGADGSATPQTDAGGSSPWAAATRSAAPSGAVPGSAAPSGAVPGSAVPSGVASEGAVPPGAVRGASAATSGDSSPWAVATRRSAPDASGASAGHASAGHASAGHAAAGHAAAGHAAPGGTGRSEQDPSESAAPPDAGSEDAGSGDSGSGDASFEDAGGEDVDTAGAAAGSSGRTGFGNVASSGASASTRKQAEPADDVWHAATASPVRPMAKKAVKKTG